jgi:phosphate transport system permease protein
MLQAQNRQELTDLNLKELRTNIEHRQLISGAFAILGLIIILVATFILLGLIFQMMTQGIPRLTPQFFLSFPSRDPEEAGILSAWVGSALVMLVTAIAAIPLGVASGI